MKKRNFYRFTWIVISLLGAAILLIFAIRDALNHAAPIWSNVGFWSGCFSPYLAWIAACTLVHNYVWIASRMLVGMVLGNVISIGLVANEAFRAPSAGGMNPYATNNLVLVLIATAVLQWFAFLLTLAVLGLVFLCQASKIAEDSKEMT